MVKKRAVGVGLFLAIGVVGGAPACGGKVASGGGLVTVSGTVAGSSIPTTDAVAILSPMQSNTVVAEVALTNVADTCGVIEREQSGGPEPSSTTVLVLAVTGSGTSVAPGTYPIAGSAVFAEFATTDAQCRSVLNDQATSGSITFSAVNPNEITGSFDVTFPDGHAAGSFTAPICAVTNGMGMGMSTKPSCGH